MPSIPLHDLHQALDKLCDAFHEDKLTMEELEQTAFQLVERWLDIEETVKETNKARNNGENIISLKFNKPNIVVENDCDGFFEALVRTWCESKKPPWKSDTMVINILSFQPNAVQCWYETKEGKNILHLQFHSALRSDLGSLSPEDIQAIIDQWF